MKKSMTMTVALFAAAAAWAVQGTISTEKDTRTGNIVWDKINKTYQVTLKKGNATINLKKEDVTGMDIPKPGNFDALAGMVESGNGGAAIAGLKKIVDEYCMLVWDKAAGRYLVQAYLARDPKKAYDTAVEIIKEDKEAAYKGEIAPAYWQALLKLGKLSVLENRLKQAAESGDRLSSARALVMRGRVILQTLGDTPENHRKALVDGYLRVILMYADPECRAARREALIEAAKSFKALRMAERAQNAEQEAQTL